MLKGRVIVKWRLLLMMRESRRVVRAVPVSLDRTRERAGRDPHIKLRLGRLGLSIVYKSGHGITSRTIPIKPRQTTSDSEDLWPVRRAREGHAGLVERCSGEPLEGGYGEVVSAVVRFGLVTEWKD